MTPLEAKVREILVKVRRFYIPTSTNEDISNALTVKEATTAILALIEGEVEQSRTLLNDCLKCLFELEGGMGENRNLLLRIREFLSSGEGK